jgi:hypothetical protein
MLREQHHTPVMPKEQQFLVMLRERSESQYPPTSQSEHITEWTLRLRAG